LTRASETTLKFFNRYLSSDIPNKEFDGGKFRSVLNFLIVISSTISLSKNLMVVNFDSAF